ncbi:hypothetical protein DSCW_58070 [Desulfosarcina widdelii]|uniref:DUF2062 domain-containing protein n=1 Tax=Desulfosarcina widdelii TaxID=947919 RepID=A0A5K7ZC50_9BACT|nr:DUF2062 domain-containing protein [Desulfosarcina widdelii]BBO78390.1 hypothetical protein DSCW_58070 [Desulfosarcina widdelii]
MAHQSLSKYVRRIYDRFIKLKEAPQEIALGFALGLMIGMTPFLGAHFAACIALASILGWSKIAAMVGVNITNVFTAPLIYPVNYWVGARLVGVSNGVRWPAAFTAEEMINLIKQSPLVLVDLCAGGLILGLPLAFAGYMVALRAVRLYRRRRSPDSNGSEFC